MTKKKNRNLDTKKENYIVMHLFYFIIKNLI